MPTYAYDRLSAVDNAFLLWETSNTHMHVSATHIYKPGSLRFDDGGVDVASIKRALSGILYRIPRYRQKLAWIPFENHAVWVDDPHFDIDFHVRHTSLPRPGTQAQLKALSARIMAQQLDRARPLWEIWVVEGLENDRFAFITKVHHCMVDGTSGVGVADILMSTSSKVEFNEAPPYVPRKAPTKRELWTDAASRRLRLPFEILRNLRKLGEEVDDLRAELGHRLRAVREVAGWSVNRASKTPINEEVGPHRKVDWLEMSLADVKAVRKALDCSVNDIVLTTVTGAVREFLTRRQTRPEETDFRVSAPVSVRKNADKGKLGNQVSTWIVRLPIDEADPLHQLDAIHAITSKLKESKQALGIETISTIADWTTSSLLSLGAQASATVTNTVVTNVPGPQQPLYLLGAEMESLFPQVPLMPNMGLGIALVSYNGKVCWGFNADADMVPDVDEFRALIEAAFGRIASLAGISPSDGALVNLDPEAKKRKPRKRAANPAPVTKISRKPSSTLLK